MARNVAPRTEPIVTSERPWGVKPNAPGGTDMVTHRRVAQGPGVVA